MSATLYDRVRASGRRTRVVRDAETGVPLIIHEQDTTPFVEHAKREAAMFDPHAKRPMQHVATIPPLVYARLVRLGIAQDPVAFRKWLNERDNRVFRTDDARRL